MRDKLLDEKVPNERIVSNHGLDAVCKINNILEGNFPNNGAPGPLARLCVHFSLEKEHGHGDSSQVEENHADESSPNSIIAAYSKPNSAPQGNTAEIRQHVGEDRCKTEACDLPVNAIDPASSKRLEEADNDHCKVLKDAK